MLPPPPSTAAPTTSTASECETRRAWLIDDAGRYDDAMAAAVSARIDLADAAESGASTELTYALAGDYVRAYGPALDLWLRLEADTEALVRDCWDALPPDAVDRMREVLAVERERWGLLRSHCRGARELFETIDSPNPWVILGVPC